jgi:4-hydroxybenzoate polyprenyltransferase
MLNDRERQLLNDLERHLEHEDPSWVSKFSDTTSDTRPSPRTRRPLVLETAIGLLALLTALSVLFDFSWGILVLASAVAVLAYIRYRRRAS